MKKFKAISPIRLLTLVKENLEFSTKDLRFSIEHGRCFVNGRVERFGSTRLREGDLVEIWPTTRPDFSRDEARVLYEDEEMLVYNKPASIASSDLADRLGVTLVHRLDRDTTGVILFAKQNRRRFEDLFRQRAIKKTYHAIVDGVPKKEKGIFTVEMGVIGRRQGAVIWGEQPGGVESETHWVCEKNNGKRALIRCHPITGRTHQIRVHMRALGHPIVGDCEYGSRTAVRGVFRPLLHATSLAFEEHLFEIPPPDDFPIGCHI